jgi:hypothetical protein
MVSSKKIQEMKDKFINYEDYVFLTEDHQVNQYNVLKE